MKVILENSIKYAKDADENLNRIMYISCVVEGNTLDMDLLSNTASRIGQITELYALHGVDGAPKDQM